MVVHRIESKVSPLGPCYGQGVVYLFGCHGISRIEVVHSGPIVPVAIMVSTGIDTLNEQALLAGRGQRGAGAKTLMRTLSLDPIDNSVTPTGI